MPKLHDAFLNLELREKIANKNIFLELTQTQLASYLIDLLASEKKFKLVRPRDIFQVISQIVLTDPEGWEPINPNLELLASKDRNEFGRVMKEISRRKSQIHDELSQNLKFTETDEGYELHYNGRPISELAPATFVATVAQAKIVQIKVWEWLNQLSEQDNGVIAIGESNQYINRKRFDVFDLQQSIIDSEQSLSLLLNSIFTQLSLEAEIRLRLESEQKEIEQPRDSFIWASNPLIAMFRDLARPIVLEHLESVRKFGVTEFDLVTQVMMHLSTYDAVEIWHGNDSLIAKVVELIKQEKGSEAESLFGDAITAGEIRLNEKIAQIECARQAEKLALHYQNLSVQVDDKNIKLPAEYMGNPELNPFNGFERTEINAKERKYAADPVTGEKTMIVTEKYSGKKITFKSVRPEISNLYSVGFSNLHYPRSGEVAIYGAYLEGDELPFAYSSYTPVVRKYSRDMITHLGHNPDNVMESARAWNCSWAPENTMSVLFSFAHDMMREKRQEDIKTGVAKAELEGVFTSINPNLGFKAVSFRGVRFNIAALKPTGFSYLRNSNGTADFMPKIEIMKKLGLSSVDDVDSHPEYVTNTIPFLPTVELIALFSPEDDQALMEKPIYRVSEQAFKAN